jgi:SAM-dependent methyltransferase
LSLSAGCKVDSIELLLERNQVIAQSMLELGAGTGAVIQECKRRKLAQNYVAVDYSPEAIGRIRNAAAGIEGVVADVTAPDFSIAGDFDVVILSHVLEHLEKPELVLHSLKKLNWKHLVLEVPLEALWLSRCKQKLTGEPPGKAAGHIQFYTARSFDQLIRSSGLVIVNRHRYVPVVSLDSLRYVSRKNRLSRLKQMQTLLTGHYLPALTGPLWSHLYYAHYAVLCVSARAG